MHDDDWEHEPDGIHTEIGNGKVGIDWKKSWFYGTRTEEHWSKTYELTPMQSSLIKLGFALLSVLIGSYFLLYTNR